MNKDNTQTQNKKPSILDREDCLYVLVVDGVKSSFAMGYSEAVDVWKYNEDKYPEKKFSIEMVEHSPLR